MKVSIFLLISFLFFASNLYAQKTVSHTETDPNFQIYICFGQSNMEGNAAIGEADRTGVDSRFQMLSVAPDDSQHIGRAPGKWYTANPPLCRWDTGLTPADYFGRTLVDSLPNNIKIGVIVIAMGGSGIDAFDKDHYIQYYQNTDAWQKGLMDIYGGNPYAKIIEMAKLARQSGVIKGILLHQGETNNGQSDWPQKVKKIYDNILEDLDMAPNSIPLLAGEMLHQEQGGICWGMNSIIAKLPYSIPNSQVISSEGCNGNGTDGFHFSTEGARELGRRYGRQMLSLVKTYNSTEGKTVDHLQAESTQITMLTGSFLKIPLTAVFADKHTQDISFRADYEISNPDVVQINNGILTALKDGETAITASYKGELGEEKQLVFNVVATTFPLTNNLFNPDIWADGSFNETTRTLKTGQWGFGGWQYDGLDLSAYNYLVARLGSNSTADVEFKLFDGNSYWGASTSNKFGNKKEVIVNLQKTKKSDGTTLNPSHIFIAGFWSNGNNPFVIDTVFLSNSNEYVQTGIDAPLYTDTESGPVDVYSIKGERIRIQVEKEKATEGLPAGVYVVGNRNGFVKILKSDK